MQVKVQTWDAWFEASTREFNRQILGKETSKKGLEGGCGPDPSTPSQRAAWSTGCNSMSSDESSTVSALTQGTVALKPISPGPHGQRASSPQRSPFPGFGKKKRVARHVVQTYLQVCPHNPVATRTYAGCNPVSMQDMKPVTMPALKLYPCELQSCCHVSHYQLSSCMYVELEWEGSARTTCHGLWADDEALKRARKLMTIPR